MSMRLKIPPGYEVRQRGAVSEMTSRGDTLLIPTEDCEETAWRDWLASVDPLPDPVPRGAPRWLCKLFAERMGDKVGHGQRHAARHLGISARAMRYYVAGIRSGEPCYMPHDLATKLLTTIRQKGAK